MTVVMFGVARGVAFLLAGGTTVPVNNSFFALIGNGRFFGVPYIVIITAIFVLLMKPGSVIVDVAIDQGGCVETSHATTHSDPTYVVDGVVHYCVANMAISQFYAVDVDMAGPRTSQPST